MKDLLININFQIYNNFFGYYNSKKKEDNKIDIPFLTFQHFHCKIKDIYVRTLKLISEKTFADIFKNSKLGK